VALVGPSGSGKSTLLHLLGALDTPTSGTIHVGENEVTALTGPALAHYRAQRVGFVFQDHHLLPQLQAVENVMLPALATGAHADARERALIWLGRVDLLHRADAYPAQLSGGERQRVAVARALLNGASLLLCDEPTGNLDRETGAQVVELLLTLARTDGVAVLMVTHNLEQAARMARHYRLHDGLLVSDTAVTGGGL
jgi:putative ABC transport system ATP-binding protein